MTRTIVLLALLASSPVLAQQKGGGTDMLEVRRQIESMQRDGRYQQLMEEGRANRLAFERLQQEQNDPTAVGSVQPRRRR